MKSNKKILFFLLLTEFVMFSCNAKEVKANPITDFYFEANKTFTEITIYRYDGKSPNVVIPSEIEGIPVTEINSFSSYMNPTKITSVVIPDTVKKIGKEAFSQCKELKYVKFSKNLEVIGTLSFFLCEKLEGIILPESLRVIGDNAFAGCKSLKTIDFKNVEYIGIGAFQETALYSVTFPQTLQYIGSRAFYNCNNLEKVILPEKFSAIYIDETNRPKEHHLNEVFSGNKINSSIALQKQLTQTKLKTGSRENLENVSKKYNIYINYHGL